MRAAAIRALVATLLSGPAMAVEGLPVDPAINQATIWDTVCVPGYTRTIRPYVSTMKAIKAEMLSAAGEPYAHSNR